MARVVVFYNRQAPLSAHTSPMCEIIKIDGPLPNAHKDAIRVIGDPQIEMKLHDGKLSEEDNDIIKNLRNAGHTFQVVTFNGSNKAFLVTSR